MSPFWMLVIGGAALYVLGKKTVPLAPMSPVQQIIDALDNVAMDNSWDANEEAFAIAKASSYTDWNKAVAIIKSTDIVRYSFLGLDTIAKAL